MLKMVIDEITQEDIDEFGMDKCYEILECVLGCSEINEIRKMLDGEFVIEAVMPDGDTFTSTVKSTERQLPAWRSVVEQCLAHHRLIN